MYIALSLIAAFVFVSMHLVNQKNKKRIAAAHKKAIELNQKVLGMIDAITVIDQETDDEILHAIMNCQDMNYTRLGNAKAGMKYLDWQFSQSKLQMDTYFEKVEKIANLSKK